MGACTYGHGPSAPRLCGVVPGLALRYHLIPNAYSLGPSREVVEVVDDAVFEDVPAHLPRDGVRVRVRVRVVGMPLPCL